MYRGSVLYLKETTCPRDSRKNIMTEISRKKHLKPLSLLSISRQKAYELRKYVESILSGFYSVKYITKCLVLNQQPKPHIQSMKLFYFFVDLFVRRISTITLIKTSLIISLFVTGRQKIYLFLMFSSKISYSICCFVRHSKLK